MASLKSLPEGLEFLSDAQQEQLSGGFNGFFFKLFKKIYDWKMSMHTPEKPEYDPCDCTCNT